MYFCKQFKNFKMKFSEVVATVKAIHVAKAVLSLKKKGIPDTRGSKEWCVLLEGRGWPPKLVIEEAVWVATGKVVDVSTLAQGGEATTNKFLRTLGFDVVKGRAV